MIKQALNIKRNVLSVCVANLIRDILSQKRLNHDLNNENNRKVSMRVDGKLHCIFYYFSRFFHFADK
jgi:hypothetical protein